MESRRFLEITMVQIMDDKGNKNKMPLKTIDIAPDEKVEVRVRVIRENTVIFNELEKVKE